MIWETTENDLENDDLIQTFELRLFGCPREAGQPLKAAYPAEWDDFGGFPAMESSLIQMLI